MLYALLMLKMGINVKRKVIRELPSKVIDLFYGGSGTPVLIKNHNINYNLLCLQPA